MPMDKKAFDEIITSIENNTCGLELDLCQKNIDDTQARRLALALTKNLMLWKLNLNSNQISESGAEALIEALKKNTTLCELTLDLNKVSFFLTKIKDATLSILRSTLSGNAIRIPRVLQFNNLKLLESNATFKADPQEYLGAIRWRQTGIDGVNIQRMCLILAKNKSVIALRLDHNELGEKGAMALLKMLETNKTLQYIDLRSTQIGDSSLKLIEQALKRNRELAESQKATASSLSAAIVGMETKATKEAQTKPQTQVVQFVPMLQQTDNNMVMEQKEFDEIIKSLEDNTYGSILVLANKNINDTQAQRLALALTKNITLKELHLNSNLIGDNVATALAKMLVENTTLQELDLRGNNINVETWELIAQALMRNRAKKLQKTVMPHALSFGTKAPISVEHDQKAFDEMIHSVENNSCGAELDLKTKHIDASQAARLALALTINTTLQRLNLSFNRIGDSGAIALAKMLESNKTLQALHLTYNQIGDSGATALARMLQSNNTLSTFDLNRNQIGDSGATALARMLQSNKTLLWLYLQNNQIEDSGAVALAKMLQSNKTLRLLDLYDNKSSLNLLKTIGQALKRNRELAESQKATASSLSAAIVGMETKATKEAQTKPQTQVVRFVPMLQQTDNNMVMEQKEFDEIIKSLEDNTYGSILVLANKNINDTQAQRLALALTKNITLKELHLNSNLIGDNGATALAKMLVENTTLQELDLRGNNINEETWKLIAQALMRNRAEKLKKTVTPHALSFVTKAPISVEHKVTQEFLSQPQSQQQFTQSVSEIYPAQLERKPVGEQNISPEDVQKSMDIKAFDEMLESVENNTCGIELDLRDKIDDDTQVRRLALALTRNTTLQKLQLGNPFAGERVFMGSINMNPLIKVLETNRTLLELSVSWTKFTHNSITALANMLKKNISLQRLCLHGTQLEASDAEILASGLETNKSLLVLELSCNNIRASGALALARMLEINKTLQELDLYSNGIGADGVEAFAEMLKTNKSLQRLCLSSCKIGDNGGKAIAKALENNKTLHTLDLGFNNINSDIMKVIEQVLARNNALAESQKVTTAPVSTTVGLEIKVIKEAQIQHQVKPQTPLVQAVIVPAAETKHVVEQSLIRVVQGPLDYLGDTKTAKEAATITAITWLDPTTVEALQQQVALQGQLLQQLQNMQPAKELEETVQQQKVALASIQQAMKHVDKDVLIQLQGKADTLAFTIAEAEFNQQAEAERNVILSQDKLSDFYYIFISQLTDCWMACKTINSGKVGNIETTGLEAIAKGVDKLGDYINLPGVKLLTDIAGKAIRLWGDRDKKFAVKRMANFFAGTDTSGPIIEALARQLTLAHTAEIQAIPTQVTGLVRKAWLGLKTLKNTIIVNDIDNAIKEYSVKLAKEFISAVMQKRLKPHPTVKDVPLLLTSMTPQKQHSSMPLLVAPMVVAASPKVIMPPSASSIPVVSVAVTAGPSMEELLKLLKAQEQWQREQDERQKNLEKQMKQQADELVRRAQDHIEQQAEIAKLKKAVSPKEHTIGDEEALEYLDPITHGAGAGATQHVETGQILSDLHGLLHETRQAHVVLEESHRNLQQTVTALQDKAGVDRGKPAQKRLQLAQFQNKLDAQERQKTALAQEAEKQRAKIEAAKGFI